MAMRWFLLLASSFRRVHSASCYSPADFSTESWPFCQVLTDSLSMYFGPAGDGDGDYMKLGLHAENHVGWSALAIGGNGGMKGAQQVVVRQVDGAWVAEERYSADYVEPHLQETQEVLLIFANESAGSTSWGVLLPTRSCKAGDRYAMEDVGMFMHWALGYSHAFSYHKERGQFHTNLVSGPPAPPPDMSSFPSVTFTMPDVPVVLGEGGSDAMNPYICGIFDLAEALPAGLLTTSKHHAAKFAPVLSSASKEFVHHMILFECADQVAVDNNFTHNHVIPNCMVRGCQTSKWPWAVGGEDLVLPDNVGVPIGNGARWYALQVHYYNPSLVPNVSDSSGVHVALAPSLRTHDAETFGVVGGASPMQRDPLPPGQAEVSIPSAVVPTQCTNQWNADEITVLGVMHHAHLVGKKLAIHVSRNGEYIGEMRREKVYDFNHQSLEGSSIKTLKKGDELTLTCSYDTSSRTEPTAFGDFTQDEMCLAYFLHYPAQNARRSIFLRALGENRISLCSDPSQSADSFQLVQNPTQLLASAVQSTAPVLTPPACEPRGDLTSSSARDVLASMGVDVSGFSMDTSSSASGWIRAVAFVAVSLASWGVL